MKLDVAGTTAPWLAEPEDDTVTRKEFDRETKVNYGAPTGSRSYYRREVRLDARGVDYLAYRANYIAHLRRGRSYWEPELATLGLGSPFRAPQAWRRDAGKELLAARAQGS